MSLKHVTNMENESVIALYYLWPCTEQVPIHHLISSSKEDRQN